MNAVEILNLTRRFGGRTAVDGLTLAVAEGETLALLGVNGAGKTTAIRALCGLIPADSGEIRVMGHPAGSEPARACVGLSPQETAVAENLTVRENLELMGRLCGMSAVGAGRAARAQIESLSLAEVENRRAGKLSGGFQRRLSIAMALVGRPKVLVLDEPTLGLDVLARRELWSVIRGLRGRTAILLTTHYLEEAEHLADRIAILAHGRLRALGTPGALMVQAGTSTFEEAFVALAGHAGQD